ncbi:MAG: aminotransferase class V-fold PLP-dependent enzyme [Anaerolineales bacterium]|nr:aminotransferase class V-fold PLP-dependent enzyme [Anaerolineales bacterium]
MTTSTPAALDANATPEPDCTNGSIANFDQLRATEYARLDRAGHVYLDYTGGCLYAARQLSEHQALLAEGVFGNPHSSNPTSRAATEGVESARAAVLRFFNADPAEYAVIFTANASGALKLVGESYPFGPGGAFLLTFDNHNSVNGIREFARAKGATVTYTPVRPPDLRLDTDVLRANLARPAGGQPRLFAYPAQSNFSGVQHDLGWVDEAQTAGWDVLLDVAAFAPTNPLDLRVVQPNFVALSFYKMFGYPTGIGALLARRSTLARLQRPWFAGGTITVASVQGDKYYLHEGAEGFEDGTLDYLNLPAVAIGLRYLEEVGVARLHTRLEALTGRLLEELVALKHRNGLPLVKVYGPTTTVARGATVTFNVFDAKGHFVDHRQVETRANDALISLRTGCFCNPGDGELALGISAEELSSCFVASRARLTLDDFRRCIDDKSTGAVRVSLGIASNAADVDRLIDFLRTMLD